MKNRTLAGVRRLTGDIADPKNYLRGLRRPADALPDNVLLFTRTRGSDLRPASAAFAFHERWVLIVALQGEGNVGMDRKPCRLTAGSVLLVPPLHLHDYSAMDARLCWLFITFDWPAHTAADQTWRGARRADRRVREKLEDLVSNWTSPQPDGLLVAAHVLGILLQLFPRAPAPRTDLDNRLITKVREAARTHTGEKLHALATRIGLSESHLRARFRQEAGISLGHYLREARLRQAAIWLRDERISVKAAAERAGFPDISAFSRAFRRVLGVPPSRANPAGKHYVEPGVARSGKK